MVWQQQWMNTLGKSATWSDALFIDVLYLSEHNNTQRIVRPGVYDHTWHAPMSLPNPGPQVSPCSLKKKPKWLLFYIKDHQGMFRSIWAQVSRFYGRK